MSDRKNTKIKNLERALNALKRSIEAPVSEPRDLSGIIKDFELTYELSWKCLKRFLENQGQTSGPPKDVFKKAYSLGVIDDETIYLQMISDRNLSVHVYDESTARKIVERIRKNYISTLETLFEKIEKAP